MPNEMTTFVGRKRELTRLRDLLVERRLITLGGVGNKPHKRL